MINCVIANADTPAELTVTKVVISLWDYDHSFDLYP